MAELGNGFSLLYCLLLMCWSIRTCKLAHHFQGVIAIMFNYNCG